MHRPGGPPAEGMLGGLHARDPACRERGDGPAGSGCTIGSAPFGGRDAPVASTVDEVPPNKDVLGAGQCSIRVRVCPRGRHRGAVSGQLCARRSGPARRSVPRAPSPRRPRRRAGAAAARRPAAVRPQRVLARIRREHAQRRDFLALVAVLAVTAVRSCASTPRTASCSPRRSGGRVPRLVAVQGARAEPWFMPSALASGSRTIFWWRGNVTPPKDYNKWADFIRAFATHLTERYGEDEVKTWYFEVWNEPNLGVSSMAASRTISISMTSPPKRSKASRPATVSAGRPRRDAAGFPNSSTSAPQILHPSILCPLILTPSIKVFWTKTARPGPCCRKTPAPFTAK